MNPTTADLARAVLKLHGAEHSSIPEECHEACRLAAMAGDVAVAIATAADQPGGYR